MGIMNFNLRISEELNEKLIKIAEEQGRSKNKQIEQILKEYVNEYENNKNSISIKQTHNKEATVNIFIATQHENKKSNKGVPTFKWVHKKLKRLH